MTYRIRYYEPRYGTREFVVKSDRELAKDREWLEAGGYSYTVTKITSRDPKLDKKSALEDDRARRAREETRPSRPASRGSKAHALAQKGGRRSRPRLVRLGT